MRSTNKSLGIFGVFGGPMSALLLYPLDMLAVLIGTLLGALT